MAIPLGDDQRGERAEPEIIAMESPATFQRAAARLLSKIRTIAAASYKTSIGQPIVYPKPHLDYCSNFLHMLFSIPFKDHEPDPDVVAALQLILVLHADHEQNCSTSTVRMVASSGANLYASCAAGVCALWGPLHGGANAAVIECCSSSTRITSNCPTTSRAKEKGSRPG
jgi:citrate synthase